MTVPQIASDDQSNPISSIHAKNRLDYSSWRVAVSKVFRLKGLLKVALRWDICNSSPRHIINRNDPVLPPNAASVWVCSASHEHDAVIFSPSCSFRVCPDCAPKQSARLISQYLPVISKLIPLHPEYRLRKITLTRKIALGDDGFAEQAKQGFDQIQKSMLKTVGPHWNKFGAGLLATWEVGETGLKLHYHCIYFGPWVDWKKLGQAWLSVTGDSHIVYVQAVKRNASDWKFAVMETLKYATKFYKEDYETGEQRFLSPELTVELFIAMKGTRRIRSYGSFYNIDTPESDVFACSACDAPMVSIGVDHWQIWINTGFSPDEWRSIVSDSLLTYRIANKSPPIIHIPGTGNRARTMAMPFLDEIPIKGTSHYDD